MNDNPYLEEIKRFYREIAPRMLIAFSRTPDNAGLDFFERVSPRCGYCFSFLSDTIRKTLYTLAGRYIPPINDAEFTKELASVTSFSFEQWKVGIIHLEGGHLPNCPRLKDYEYLERDAPPAP